MKRKFKNRIKKRERGALNSFFSGRLSDHCTAVSPLVYILKLTEQRQHLLERLYSSVYEGSCSVESQRIFLKNWCTNLLEPTNV